MKASRGEIKIHEILEKNDVNFKEEYEFPGLKARNSHYIYVHLNKINGKCYVGQTNNPQERWKNKGSRYKDSPRFYNAIKKYGWNNFSHVILEEDLTQEEANQREVFWIKELDSNNEEHGYNLTIGGNNNASCLWQDEDYRKRMSESFSKAKKKQWENPEFSAQAQEKMQCGVKAFWNDPVKRQRRIENISGSKNPNSKVVQNLETGLIFSTIKEAAQWSGLKCVSTIGQCCRGERKSAGKHSETKEPLHWRYVKEVMQE